MNEQALAPLVVREVRQVAPASLYGGSRAERISFVAWRDEDCAAKSFSTPFRTSLGGHGAVRRIP